MVKTANKATVFSIILQIMWDYNVNKKAHDHRCMCIKFKKKEEWSSEEKEVVDLTKIEKIKGT